MRQSEESNGIADRVCDLRSVLTVAPLSSVSSALSLQLSAAPAPSSPLIHLNHQQHWSIKVPSGTMLKCQRSRQSSSRHSTCKPTAARIVTSAKLMSIGICCTGVNHVGATCNGHTSRCFVLIINVHVLLRVQYMSCSTVLYMYKYSTNIYVLVCTNTVCTSYKYIYIYEDIYTFVYVQFCIGTFIEIDAVEYIDGDCALLYTHVRVRNMNRSVSNSRPRACIRDDQ